MIFKKTKIKSCHFHILKSPVASHSTQNKMQNTYYAHKFFDSSLRKERSDSPPFESGLTALPCLINKNGRHTAVRLPRKAIRRLKGVVKAWSG